MGDSIVKHIDPNKILSKNPEIHCESVTAYTWEEAKDFVLNKQSLPDSIVLHLGTNNIRNGQSTENILKLAKGTSEVIKQKNCNTNITISAVIPRGDSSMLDMERQCQAAEVLSQ